ncbi:MAG: hypothetical protein G01um10148_745 [Parcubacteria group bacterium Gr01-1014_8]|nr:MAG: hypothetical protein G01um10148_745 [Parcubacteria group bacterium Gr01-1014_8]
MNFGKPLDVRPSQDNARPSVDVDGIKFFNQKQGTVSAEEASAIQITPAALQASARLFRNLTPDTKVQTFNGRLTDPLKVFEFAKKKIQTLIDSGKDVPWLAVGHAGDAVAMIPMVAFPGDKRALGIEHEKLGTSRIVEITDDNREFLAEEDTDSGRPNAFKALVMKMEPPQTDQFVAILRKRGGVIELAQVFSGMLTPPIPNATHAPEVFRSYAAWWEKHAVVTQ